MKTLRPTAAALRSYLQRVPLFAQCPEEDLARLLDRAMLLQYERGEHGFLAGEKATRLDALISGGAQIYRTLPDGTAKTLHLFSPPALLAEAAVFMGIPYPASCLFTEESLTLSFRREHLIELVERDPAFAWRLIGQLYRKLHEFTDMIASHGQKNAVSRVASYLLGFVRSALAESPGAPACVTLPAPKKDIANYLGIRPESLSRTFAQLERAGAIQVEGQSIHILQAAYLENILLDSDPAEF
jgi:CRP/FNR family transcriptional regulator, dissimilatory nitrate respiration regulator